MVELWAFYLTKKGNCTISGCARIQEDTKPRRCLTHDAVCAVGGGGARGGAVVIAPAPAPSPSVEAGHGRKAGADVCRRVRRVALRREQNETVQGKGQTTAKRE